jgi:hypothetical protein
MAAGENRPRLSSSVADSHGDLELRRGWLEHKRGLSYMCGWSIRSGLFFPAAFLICSTATAGPALGLASGQDA